MRTILDTSALITLYQIDTVRHLNSFYNEVFIPLKVEVEFLKDDTDKRFTFLLNFYEENYWFKKCQTFHYDMIQILLTYNKIDDGEREAMAQYKQLQLDLLIEEGNISCILDDKAARKVATNMDIKINGTLYLLAKMHFNGNIDYHKETSKLKKLRWYSDKNIKDAYEKVRLELGIA